MISVRATRQEDLKWIINAESDTENKIYVDQWSFEEHLNSLQDTDIRHLLITDENDNKVGYIILAGLENENNTIEFRRLVVTQKNNGYGKSAIEELLRLSFVKFGCHRLWLDVKIHNKKAIYMYESIGFKREGLLRECVLANGNYESIYLYSLLKNEYEEHLNILESGLKKSPY